MPRRKDVVVDVFFARDLQNGEAPHMEFPEDVFFGFAAGRALPNDSPPPPPPT
eukprot:gene29507-39934_t